MNAITETRDFLLTTRGRPIHAIIAEVCEKYDLTPAQIIGPQRHRFIVIARHEAYYRCAKETPYSLPAIGRVFCRDHTSIMSGIKRHEKRMAALAKLETVNGKD